MTKKQFHKQIRLLFAERRKELLEQLSRLDKRQKEGWGYRRVLRKGHKVPAHSVRAHYAMVPVKTR